MSVFCTCYHVLANKPTSYDDIVQNNIRVKGFSLKYLPYIRYESNKTFSRAWFRSTDLWVMGPARFHCATLLNDSSGSAMSCIRHYRPQSPSSSTFFLVWHLWNCSTLVQILSIF